MLQRSCLDELYIVLKMSKWLNIGPRVTDHITVAYFTAGSSRDAESSMPDVLLDNKHEIADDWRHVDTVSFSIKIIFKKYTRVVPKCVECTFFIICLGCS